MNYGEIKFNDIANGEGVRTSLFVSGCRHHCKNCFNEQTWDFAFGQPFTEETMEEILIPTTIDNGLSFGRWSCLFENQSTFAVVVMFETL